MTDYLTIDRFAEILEHNKNNNRDDDIWILNEDGSIQVIPDRDIDELLSPESWPMYVCRAAGINAHVEADTKQASRPTIPDTSAVDGLISALDFINWSINLIAHQRALTIEHGDVS